MESRAALPAGWATMDTSPGPITGSLGVTHPAGNHSRNSERAHSRGYPREGAQFVVAAAQDRNAQTRATMLHHRGVRDDESPTSRNVTSMPPFSRRVHGPPEQRGIPPGAQARSNVVSPVALAGETAIQSRGLNRDWLLSSRAHSCCIDVGGTRDDARVKGQSDDGEGTRSEHRVLRLQQPGRSEPQPRDVLRSMCVVAYPDPSDDPGSGYRSRRLSAARRAPSPRAPNLELSSTLPPSSQSVHG